MTTVFLYWMCQQFYRHLSEDRIHVSAQVAVPLVSNFPSKVPLCLACSLRDSVGEKNQSAQLDINSNKTFTKMKS